MGKLNIDEKLLIELTHPIELKHSSMPGSSVPFVLFWAQCLFLKTFLNPYLVYCLHPLAKFYGWLTMRASLWGLLVLWLLLQWTTTIVKSPPFAQLNTWDVFRLVIIINIIIIIFFLIIKNDIEIAIYILWFCDLV